jgi:hypothetical protein
MKPHTDSAASSKPLKGLMATIITSARFKGCANGGISERCEKVVIVGDGIAELFEATSAMPAVKLVVRDIGGRVVHAEPVEPVKPGNIGYTSGGGALVFSDSRLCRALEKLGYPSHCAIILHDRHDTQEQYDALTR